MKRTWLRLLLLLIGLYVAYLIVGAGLLYKGKVRKWTIFPNKMITASNWDVDESGAGVDGPYIFYARDVIIRRSIIKNEHGLLAVADTFPASERAGISIACRFPEHPEWDFATRLKDTLVNEPAVYPAAPELFVLSDIEGNFGALRSLLLAGRVMDEQYRWTFGSGHLVLVGDFFDRGLHVTECLWLIYHLEQGAAAAGGKLHYVLGNHEIMNMQGDLRYVRNKYFRNALLLGSEYQTLYGPDSELGRWLNTKNVVEQVGLFLFAHGGISEAVSALQLPLQELNEHCRPWYFSDARRLRSQAPEPAKTLFQSRHSPFWYRDLVQEDASGAHVDAVLKQYSAEAIVVGHTLVDHIRTFYGGKVIATDVHHAGGTIEALRVQGGKLNRMDTTGRMTPL